MAREVVGIKAITGEQLLATKDVEMVKHTLLPESPGTAVTKYTRIRSVQMLPHPDPRMQGKDLLQMMHWCQFEDVSLSEEAWAKLRVCDFKIPKQLEDGYIQSTSGIALR